MKPPARPKVWLCSAVALLWWSGCSGCDTSLQPLRDGGLPDASTQPDAEPTDAGTDAGEDDAGAVEAGDGGTEDAGPRDAGRDGGAPKDPCDEVQATGVFAAGARVEHHFALEGTANAPAFGRSYIRRDGEDLYFAVMTKEAEGLLLDDVPVPTQGTSWRNFVVRITGDEAMWLFDEETALFTYIHDPRLQDGLLTYSLHVREYDPGDGVSESVSVARSTDRLGTVQLELELRAADNDVGLITPSFLDDGSVFVGGATTGPSTLMVAGGPEIQLSGGGGGMSDALLARLPPDGEPVVWSLPNPGSREGINDIWVADEDLIVVRLFHTGNFSSAGIEASNPLGSLLLGLRPEGAIGWHIAVSDSAPGESLSTSGKFFARGDEVCVLLHVDNEVRLDDGVSAPLALGTPDSDGMTLAVACFTTNGVLVRSKVLLSEGSASGRGNTVSVQRGADGRFWVSTGMVGSALLGNGEQVASLGGWDALLLELDEDFDILSVSQLRAPGDVWPTDLLVEDESISLLVGARSCLRVGDELYPQPADGEEHLRFVKMPLP